ncbi:hypothetical protein B0H67DRAFT_384492 [Lasiosphaeris hirsuta]|uniref:Uncharacterized protein n=1 Tax=Lasiosphaeris hirsuta TaxID=260670 RepID=A0AA39ZXH8_9PEZI|nr:hypothetical protein B0H67DRAFT_384492 [Lasiosphaeris hirsuta]
MQYFLAWPTSQWSLFRSEPASRASCRSGPWCAAGVCLLFRNKQATPSQCIAKRPESHSLCIIASIAIRTSFTLLNEAPTVILMSLSTLGNSSPLALTASQMRFLRMLPRKRPICAYLTFAVRCKPMSTEINRVSTAIWTTSKCCMGTQIGNINRERKRGTQEGNARGERKRGTQEGNAREERKRGTQEGNAREERKRER